MRHNNCPFNVNPHHICLLKCLLIFDDKESDVEVGLENGHGYVFGKYVLS